MFFRGASAAIIVFDAAEAEWRQVCLSWLSELKKHVIEPIDRKSVV